MTIPTFWMISYIPLASNAGTEKTFCNRTSKEVYVAFLGNGPSEPWGGGTRILYYSKGWFKWMPGECSPVPVLADRHNRTYGFYAISADGRTIWENMNSDTREFKYCIRKENRFDFGFKRVDDDLGDYDRDFFPKKCSSKGGIVVDFLKLRTGTTGIVD
jgi:uncharacterized membrane protein